MAKKSSGRLRPKSPEELVGTADPSEEIAVVHVGMGDSVVAVEGLLGYKFRNKGLLQEALTHTSHPDSASYQRLEFVGDAALGLVITNHIYLTDPNLDPGYLSLLRSANVSTEKLARVAVRYDLYRYLRRNAPPLDEKVREFTRAIKGEVDGEVSYVADVKAPKVLADIVESIAAAVYVDCDFSLEVLWMVFRVLLEPIVTKETLQPQPVTALYEFCHKQGKHVDFQELKKGSITVVSVYVDRKRITRRSSEQKDIAKLHAAREALRKLSVSESSSMEMDSGPEDIEGAKVKLFQLCNKERWPKPVYRVEKELGPGHDKRFISSVQVTTPVGEFQSNSDEKSRVKDAENSAASAMLRGLEDLKNACSELGS